MKWLLKEPMRGDMIRVQVGALLHYGIYVSDDEVIQFGLLPNQRDPIPDSEVEVLSSNIDTFLGGGFLEVCEFDRREKKKNRKPKEVVEYARSKIGSRGYSFLLNNCEHFANECISGNRISDQAKNAIAIFRTLPQLDVYFSALPESEIGAPLECVERNDEISSIKNERLKREKYYAWRLLEHAAKTSFGIKSDELAVQRSKGGKWTSDKLCFSISHSDGALAVAVSVVPVGIDIEPADGRAGDRLAERTMTKSEFDLYLALPEDERKAEFIRRWTAKEAIFKSRDEEAFIPSDIDTLRTPCRQGTLEINEKKYIYSVFASSSERTRIFNNVKLS